MKNPKGFTLLEVILTLAIVGILFGVSALGLGKLQQSIAARASDREIINIFSSAARKARHGLRGTNWGVYIPYNETTRSTDTVTVFSGTSYATRNSAYDVVYSVNTDIQFVSVDFSGAAPDATNSHEIVFNVLSGATTGYGSLTLSWYDSTRTVDVNAQGIVTRQ